MRRLGLALILVLAGSVSSLFSSTDTPVKSAKSALATTVKINDVSYAFPFRCPSKEEILRAYPEIEPSKIVSIQCELLLYRLDEPRSFPLVGRARLAHVHFKCTVSTGTDNHVGYIDKDYLLLVEN